jgi:hypothetical protein
MVNRLQEHRAAGRDAYAFFKHEETPQGAIYAVEVLRELAHVQATDASLRSG